MKTREESPEKPVQIAGSGGSSCSPSSEETDSLCACCVYANLTQARVIEEEGTTSIKMPPLDWPVGKPVGKNVAHFLD